MAGSAAPPLQMTDDQRAGLKVIALSASLPFRKVRQARALIMAADGVANVAIAREVGVNVGTVRAWRKRFAQDGVEGVGVIRPGRGRKPRNRPRTVEEIGTGPSPLRPEDGSEQQPTRTVTRVGVGGDTVDHGGEWPAYLPRVAEQEIKNRLRFMPIVLVEGPRGCGKTTTARRICASEALLDEDPNAMLQVSLQSQAILQGPTPRLIDEWQLAPGIWNMVRRASDRRGLAGQFILTGSANPPDDTTRHSGAGRVARVRMRPMSLYESRFSNGATSLAGLFNGDECSASGPGKELQDVIEATCRGGWPQCWPMKVDDAQEFLMSYLDEISRVDISRVDGVRRDPIGVGRLIRSLARNIATSARYNTLAADTGGDRLIDRRTVRQYMRSLERLFVVENLPAWSPRLRSRTALRASPKLHLIDPALAAAALEADPSLLMNDLNTFGFLFESLVVRDLRIYTQRIRGRLTHYRDESGLETDVIIRRNNGDWIAVEVKLGGQAAVDAAAASLLKMRKRVDTDVVGLPRKLVVVTAVGNHSFERADGVTVVPISTLGP